MHELLIKRVYAEIDPGDGYRILVDRLWPRGISKSKAGLDDWIKAIAPSTELRKIFHHDSAKMNIFKENYLQELNLNPAATEFLKMVSEKLKKENVTLLFGAKNEVDNHATVLRDWIMHKLRDSN